MSSNQKERKPPSLSTKRKAFEKQKAKKNPVKEGNQIIEVHEKKRISMNKDDDDNVL